MLNRLNPMARKLQVPGVVDILVRSASLSSVRSAESARNQADLYLHPALDQYGILDFEHVDEIVELGYRHTRLRLSEHAF